MNMLERQVSRSFQQKVSVYKEVFSLFFLVLACGVGVNGGIMPRSETLLYPQSRGVGSLNLGKIV
jgi:hypothetical protein